MGRDRTKTIARDARTRSRAWMLSCALVLASSLLAGCGSSADSAGAADEDAPKQHGGTLTMGMNQQPACLNTWLACGTMSVSFIISNAVFEAPLLVDDAGEFQPELATAVPTVENGLVVVAPSGEMRVTVDINEKARWSDGRPITCEDARFTIDTILDDRWMILERGGYDLISEVECPDPQTAVYVFREPYAPYLRLLISPYMPKHALEGKDFNTFMNDRIDVSSGPFRFGHWDRSVEIVLVRNERYWDAGADDRPFLDRLRFRFIADANTLKIQLRTGEVDLIQPPPDTSLREELADIPRIGSQRAPSMFSETLSFNVAKAPTNDLNVREAIAASIDRQRITDTVLRKQVGVLQSTLRPSHKGFFIPAWEDVRPDADRAAELLERSGYERSGQYYTKNGEVLTVEFKTTSNDTLRMKVAQLLQQELKSNGIRMTIALEPPEIFFAKTTKRGAFNMAMWARSAGADPQQREVYACDKIPSSANDYSGSNSFRYCDEHVTDLLKRADVEPDVDERAALIQEIQREVRKDMPVLPLFQKPDTVAYREHVRGVRLNSLSQITWNAADWSVR